MKSRFIIALVALSLACGLQAMPVAKINQRGAKAAWDMASSVFNPKATIPDSMAQSNSAVIIARYNGLSAVHEYTPSIVKEQRADYGSNITRAREIERVMIKLLDNDAVKRHANFEFGKKDEQWLGNIKLTDIEEGFGVRVYKPDGTMHEVDLSQALPIADGKKGNKKRSNRITIPGLEVGDVLDYFYYTEEMRDELDISVRDVTFAARYPMLNCIVECSVDPTLTLEMRANNGAPLPVAHLEDGQNKFRLHTVNLGAVPSTKYINAARQLPFLEMRILNNNSQPRYSTERANMIGGYAISSDAFLGRQSSGISFKPKSARKGGVYVLPSQTYYQDIAYFLRAYNYKSDIPGRAASMTKEYRKATPDAGARQLSDYTYVAVMYLSLINDEKFSPTELSFMLRDAADKAKFTIPSGIGFIKSSHDIPLSMITSWRSPDYVAMIGDRPYNPGAVLMCAPGEWPLAYQAEEGGCYRKVPEDALTSPEMFTIPPTKPNTNTRIDEMTLALDSATGKATLTGSISAVGGHKQILASRFNDRHSWLNQAEDYLGIADKDRHNDTAYDPEGASEELYKAMKGELANSTGLEPLTVDTVAITSRGVMPGAKSFACNYRATFDNITVDAGDETVVNIGKLFSDMERITGNDRKRDFDAVVSFPNNYIRKLTFALPEGYTIKSEALTALNKSVSNNVGSFSTRAEANDGMVTIDVNTQMRGYVIPAAQWHEFLDITDAAADFAGAVLIVNKEK